MTVGAFRAFSISALIGMTLFALPLVPAFAQEAEGEAAYAEAPADGAPGLDAMTFDDWAEGGADGTGAQGGAIISPWTVLTTLLSLALVALAIYGLVFLLKKAARGGRGGAGDPFLKILAAAPVGANRGVYVVSLGSQAWLIGAADRGVNLIAEVSDREIIDAMVLEDSRKGALSSLGRFADFRSVLRRFGVSSEPGAPSPDDIRKRSERLKGV